MKHRTLFISILMVSLLVFGISAQAQDQNPIGSDNATLENDNIVVDITGGQNVPAFSFYTPDDTDTVYRVQFNNMFEVVDSNDNGQFDSEEDSIVPLSQQALAAWTWDFSSIEEGDGETTFNITGDGSPAPVMGNFDLQFVNHLGDNADSFKFDVIVGDYQFVSSDENAMLVLAFTLTAADGGDDADENGNAVQFGDAYMDIEETAQTDDGDINVGLTTPENGSAMAYIAYENFNGGFVHDPTLGFGDAESGFLPVSTFAVLSSFLVLIPVTRYLRKN